MYNTQNNALAEQKFMLPAAMPEGEFTQEELAEDMDGLQMSFPRVKIPAGGALMFELPSDDPENPDYVKNLEGVILFNHPNNAYWPEGSEYDDSATPLCSSVDAKQGIGEPGGSCISCALNQFGSAAEGNGKACKNMRVLYLLRSGEFMPLQVTLPPTSLKPFREFMNQSFMLRRRATYGSVVQIGLKKMSKMVVTSVCGAAAGAGVSLALGGDFMICADNAKFILAFVNLGLVPDTGATYLLAKAIGTARTMELAATGRPVTAQEAKDWGLAYKVTTVEELDEVTMKFAKKLAAGPLISYKNIKKQLYDVSYADYKKWLDETEVPTQRECAASMDFQEGCKAFMEKRKAVFEGK